MTTLEFCQLQINYAAATSSVMTKEAPGKPGIEPRWTSSAKIGVGTAMSGASDLWFTISHGIINEVYFPRVDIANTRDFGLVVTDGGRYFSEEKRHAVHEYATVEDGIPAFLLTNSCSEGRYKIEKTIFADSSRSVLLQKVIFTPLQGSLEDYHLYFLLSPHLNNAGYGNSASASHFKAVPMLYAERAGIHLACSTTAPLLAMTCGYVGVSDAWQDLHRNGHLTETYSRANDGNIALCGEIDLKACKGEFVLALGLAYMREQAALQTLLALNHNFAESLHNYLEGWREVQGRFSDLSQVDKEGGRLFRMSMSVLKTHAGKQGSGSVIASLSIPWGFSKGDLDIGGYHLIWPRDQVQTSLAAIGAGDLKSARESLLFLMATQESDGHWVQCMWADGSPYWKGLQLDETALPILLADLLNREGCVEGLKIWPMIEKAARFLVAHGPVTDQDRWEENSGYTPFTLAVQVAALLVAADFFDQHDKSEEAEELRLVADWWNESIERWIYVEETPLALACGVKGYYVRLRQQTEEPYIVIKNRPVEEAKVHFTDLVSVDALALVRYGLRAADDPRLLDTVIVIDQILKTETSKGPVWHRYNGDGYGEHEDGSPFDGTGVGRGWPLLSGERAHYELAKGDKKRALALLRDMARLAGVGGMIPEQIWDAPDNPSKVLYNGHSSGSAKPLVWAHAEYVKLLRSLQDGKVFDAPPQTIQRYLKEKKRARFAIWQPDDKIGEMSSTMGLRFHLKAPARIRFSFNDWQAYEDLETTQNVFGLHVAELATQKLPAKSKISFTFFWLDGQRWEECNYEILIID